MDDDHTPRLDLPYLAAAQAQKHVTVNEALARLDGLVACRVESRTLSAPPPAPAQGVGYIAPDGALSGEWAHAAAGDLIRWIDGAWSIEASPVGLIALIADEGRVCIRDPEGWRPLAERLGSAQAFDLLGVGTTADAGNPLAAKLNKVLFTARSAAEGGDGDLRVTLNKEAASDVLSLLFQVGYAARAEIGLVGDDDLRIRVSPDGSAWITALRVERGDGAVSLPARPLGVGEGGTGARTAADACAALEALPLGGGRMSGRIVTSPDSGLVCSTAAEAFPPPSLILDESEHPTSNRSTLQMGGGWAVGQDLDGTGTRDLFFYNETLNASQVLLPVGGGIVAHGVPVFDGSGTLSLRVVSSGALPSAAPAGRMVWCADAGAAGLSDGVAWRRITGGLRLATQDADRTLGVFDAPVQVQTGVLTALRHVLLPTTAATGASFRFVRSDTGGGALDVGGLKTLAPQSWCEVAFDGSTWRLIGAGAL